MTKSHRKSRMLVFHSAYTYDYFKMYGMEIFVQARDAGNFFQEVLTVSPIASLQYSKLDNRNYSKLEFFKLNSKNRILEGEVASQNSVYHADMLIPRLNLANRLLSSQSLFPSGGSKTRTPPRLRMRRAVGPIRGRSK